MAPASFVTAGSQSRVVTTAAGVVKLTIAGNCAGLKSAATSRPRGTAPSNLALAVKKP
ncbi:hypothetical protein OG535_38775 [Kitasatospora sp. NBC_00085]|uniref:hypothetical protein n=1 Tax=unclassified Kitasatospora TaxID=2633591 RepID=UPI003249E1F4